MLAGLLLVYVGVQALWPLARLFATGFSADDDGQILGVMRDVLSSRSTLRALENTIAASSASVLISVLMGVVLAVLIGCLDLRNRAAMTFMVLSPLLIPSQIMALAWIQMAGYLPLGGGNPIYSGSGIALLMGIEHMPLVYIAARAAIMAIPADLIEAARLSGATRPRILRRIVFPLILPAIAAGGALSFAAAIGNFGVPALLGIPGRFPMLTTLIYQRLNGFGPSVIGQVAVLALLLVALSAVAFGLRQLAMRRAVPVPSGQPFPRMAIGQARPWIEIAIWAVLFVTMILPCMALLATALSPALGVALRPSNATLAPILETLANPAIQRAIMNSLALASVTAILSAIVAILFAWLTVVARNPVARRLDPFADIAFIVPGTVLALAMILVFLPPLPLLNQSLYGTAGILLVAYLARFLPLVLRPVTAAATADDPSLDEAAQVFGAGLWARIGRIFTPRMMPAAIAGAVLVVMTAINELTLSSLLWSSGNETLGVMIFSMQYEGNSTGAAALSVIALGLMLVLALLADRICRRTPHILPWR
ncbi:iron ABC transporter permease [Falsirhodobacter sp. alg1]|uniref:ABC transporter permease n=1 Tax=Falsirhodobacter sp. alg1 TaxID=1472418 RepID=UPI0005F003BD|nr:iron ABC transporter permease [Falsirhodobacter sp. alg1]